MTYERNLLLFVNLCPILMQKRPVLINTGQCDFLVEI